MRRSIRAPLASLMSSPAFMCFGRSTVVAALPVFIVRHKAWRAFRLCDPSVSAALVESTAPVAWPQAGGEKIHSYW